MKRLYIALFTALLLFLAAQQPLSAWSYHTHRKITADAVRLMPESFRQEFSGHKSHFLKGSTDPDTMIKDFANHAYHPDGSHVDGLYRVISIYDKAVELISKKESPDKVAYLLGLLSHYVADLNQPLHTAGSERDPSESEYHSKFERDLNPHLKDLVLPQLVYQPVDSAEKRVKEMTTEANRYYEQIYAAYRGGNGLPQVKEMADRQITASIQNVVDFWLGAYKDAGRTFTEAPVQAFQADTTAWNLNDNSKSGGEMININSAAPADMATFFNITPQKAQKIVEGRPFNTAYDLAKVEGFTVHFVKRHKERIKVQ